jgi:multiple sugar transport system substrate-binding protein
MMKKWNRALSLMALSAIILLSGCGSNNTITNVHTNKGNTGSTVGGKETVTFWASAVTPERDAFFKKIVQDFEKKNPSITVNYLGIPGDLNAYEQKVNVAIAAGQEPDITNYFISDLIAKGVLQPLNDYFNKWSQKDKISPETIESVKSMDPIGMKMYALPYSVQAWNVWVRPDWFKMNNLTIPQTWNQFFTAAPKLTDKFKGQYGLSIRGGSGSANTLEMLMYSYSGITNYFTKDGKSTINDPLNVKFVEKYLGQYNITTPEDDLNNGWTELSATFQSGKAAMIVHNLGSASSFAMAFGGDQSKYKAIPFPKSVKGNEVYPQSTPLGLTMFKSAKYKDAVWKFMTFYLSKDINSAYGKLYGEIPANLDAAKDSWVQQLPYMKMGVELLNSPITKFTDNPYYLPGYTVIQKKVEPMIQEVMAKKMTAKTLLDQWADLLTQEKAIYDAANKM